MPHSDLRLVESHHLTCHAPMDRSPHHLARNVARLSHLDLPGAGQVTVAGDYAYVGHIPNKQRLGTSILDVRDPKNPRVVSQISLDDPDSHSHKARVAGDIMIVNSERNMTPIGRRAEELPRLRARLRESLKREPSHAELPEKPQEVSRWWMPGQNLAAGENPSWAGKRHRLHHALRFGDKLWAGCWHAGVRVIDISNIRAPRTIGEYNYHPPFPEPSHTFMPVPFEIEGRRIALAIDEEDHAHDEKEVERRRGRPHGCLWVLDVTDFAHIKPLSIFEVSELDSPWSRATPGRFGAHQFREHMKDTLVYCAWFAGGLRIVDIADPLAPREVGYFIPEPGPGKAAPQTNDVDVDSRGLVYIVDRYAGFDVL